MELSEYDIIIIRKEQRPSFVIFGILVLLIILCDLIVILNNTNSNLITLILLNLLGFSLSYYVLHRMNKNFNNDLSSNEKIKINKVIQKKNIEPDYEPSRHMLQSQIFSLLISIKGRKELLPSKKMFLIVDNRNIYVDESIYNSVKEGDSIELIVAKHSNTILGINKKDF